MKHVIRLTESDLHRLVKESVRRILAETDASAAGGGALGGCNIMNGTSDETGGVAYPFGGGGKKKSVGGNPFNQSPIIRRPSPVGEPTNKKEKGVDMSGAIDRKGGKNHSIAMNHVNEEVINEFNWKAAALGGIMAMSPMQGNAQTQDYNPNRQDRNSVEALTKQYNKTYSIKELVQMFPQAYVDRNANPEVWIENARQGKYTPTVKDNGDGRYRTMMVAYIAAKNGQNPWEALIKRYCPQEDNVFQLGDFDI
jgi:hypothetical protein